MRTVRVLAVERTLRIGTLGTARITPAALIRPARNCARASVVAVASRDASRARAFADRHRIPRVHASYASLLADEDIDAVYIPLPNSLHAEWTLRALEAGKHVLCEKPFTANAKEAEQVADAADRAGVVVMEAFHYRYHPLAQRMVEVVRSGEIGRVEHIEASLCFPLPRFSDIRYRYDLAGGALMDAGCYAVHMARTLGGEEPQVRWAAAKRRDHLVDRAMTAELTFPGGHAARVRASLWSSSLLRVGVRVVGDAGELRVFNPVGPQHFHRFVVRSPFGRHHERFPRRPTYEYQLEAFCDAALEGRPILTPPSDSVANMRVIDAIYDAAGLPRRGA
jgi:predicted dehydrogenase